MYIYYQFFIFQEQITQLQQYKRYVVDFKGNNRFLIVNICIIMFPYCFYNGIYAIQNTIINTLTYTVYCIIIDGCTKI